MDAGVLPATVALVNPGTATLGGMLTVTVKDGVATFTGLSINQLGTGYRLMVYTDPLTTTLTTPVTVPVVPTIVAEHHPLRGQGQARARGRLRLDFSKPLDATPAQNVTNYTVTQTVTFRGRKLPKAVALMSAVYDASTNAVTLTIAGNPAPFATGGMIVVNGPSPTGGITDTLGGLPRRDR